MSMICKNIKQFFIGRIVRCVCRELLAAGAERCRRRMCQRFQCRFIGKLRIQCTDALLQNALDAVDSTVNMPNLRRIQRTADNPCQCRVDRGSRSAGLTDNRISHHLIHLFKSP